MSKITEISRAIQIDKKHIDEYPLESEVGTKRMKENFHKNAVIQRNNYVKQQQDIFNIYNKQVYKEMKRRVDKYLPNNKNTFYDEEKKKLLEVKDLIKFTNKYLDSSLKLELLPLVSSIKDDAEISLDNINSTIEEFMNKFLDAGVNLSINDFSYSIFTYKYMTDYLNKDNNINLKESFESIYWECPHFLKHLKLNLWNIIDKYKKQLDIYSDKIMNEKLSNLNLDKNNILTFYNENMQKLELEIRRDPYINLNVFLDKKRNISDYLEESSIRKNNFNFFTSSNDFDSLGEIEKNKYYSEILDLAKTLPILKLYYRYEFIIKDLKEKFSKKNENKNLYENKLKEIKKEESKRSKLFSSYLKANGIGFLAKYDDKKISISKLQMNEEILKLYDLYNELHDLEITYKMNKYISDISSLYDLFMLAYSSYFYLEKMFNEKFIEDDGFSINDEFIKYFDFIYNIDNSFLTKINGFVDYDITETVAEKYKLLELKVEKESIDKDTIDSTVDTVNFIRLVKDIMDGTLSLYEMNFIVKFREFDEINCDEVNNDEFL